LRVARAGRTEALVQAHADAIRPGQHGKGSMGKQAPDQLVTGANPVAVEPCRFEPVGESYDWPYSELWAFDLMQWPPAGFPRLRRVAAAVAVHRAIVRAIGEDVPSFVTGRVGAGPRRGAGHLAIHIARWPFSTSPWRAYLAIPRDVSDADLAQLAAALERPLRCGAPRSANAFTLGLPRAVELVARDVDPGSVLTTDVPFVVEVNGGPRRGKWTLDDAAVCSVGFALRGVLEQRGVEWGTGWAFRSRLVSMLREEFGVEARTQRVTRGASAYVHRARESELVVAAHADVVLGDLALDVGAGFLAIGGARHLGGGLLVPGGVDRGC
jgi:CRISPR-associated protein Csb2